MSKENKFGIGSAGHITIDVKKTGFMEVWSEFYGEVTNPVRCFSIEQAQIAFQAEIRKILEKEQSIRDSKE